jgi:hypothetical protein
VKKMKFIRHPGENRVVQSIRKPVKNLDSGFRRNDAKKNQINFFTASPVEREGESTMKSRKDRTKFRSSYQPKPSVGFPGNWTE